MGNNFSRGSEWRRWDLHIHTPETVKNDQYKGTTINEKWENFYNDINRYIDPNNPVKNIAAIVRRLGFLPQRKIFKNNQAVCNN